MFFFFTFDQIYSNICELCDIYFPCKKYNLNEKSKSKC